MDFASQAAMMNSNEQYNHQVQVQLQQQAAMNQFQQSGYGNMYNHMGMVNSNWNAHQNGSLLLM
jgi:hypothetical protein